LDLFNAKKMVKHTQDINTKQISKTKPK